MSKRNFFGRKKDKEMKDRKRRAKAREKFVAKTRITEEVTK